MTEGGNGGDDRRSGNGRYGFRRRFRLRSRGMVVVEVAAVALALDQITKALAVAHLGARPVELVGPLRFVLVYNTGVAFSLLSGLTVPIVLVVVALIGLLTRFARTVPSYTAAAGIGLVIGGALGNLADRLLRPHGEVVDFIWTGFWPTFNVADACIVCGGAVVAVALWRAGRAGEGPEPAGSPLAGAGPGRSSAENGPSGPSAIGCSGSSAQARAGRGLSCP